MSRQRKILLIVITCLGLLGLAGCRPGGAALSGETDLQTATVVRDDLVVSVNGNGSLEASDEVSLVFDNGGRVRQVYVEEGDAVYAGQLLAVLEPVDPEPLELAVTQAEVALMQAEYNLDQAENPFTDEEIEDAEQAVEDAEDYLDLADDMLNYALQHGSDWEVTQWKMEVLNAEIQLEMAKDTLDDMFNERDEDQIAILRKQVTAAEQALAETRSALDAEYLSAPFAGEVAGVAIETGDILSAASVSQIAAVHLVDSSRMELTVRLDEIDTPGVQVGQKALIEFDAVPDLTLEGEVISIAPLPLVEAGVVLYNVRISFEVPPEVGLRAGMSATADIVLRDEVNVLLVPDRAVDYDTSGNPFVRVVTATGENGATDITERAVVIGISDGFQTEIMSGLEEGEVVAIDDVPVRSEEESGFFGG